jgi:molybdenum cofactor biosynthesis protein B
MVDFQSRDTSRGYLDDEDDGDDDPAADAAADAAGAEEQAATGGDADPQTEAARTTEPAAGGLGVGLVTVTADGSAEDDPAGDAVVEVFEPADLAVATREFIQPGFDRIQSTVSTVADRDDVDLVVTVGATEAGPDDVVPEAVDPLLDRDLPGFGELLRLLAHEEAGSGVLTMRPVAGILDATPVFCLPGEEWAARLGATEIVVPEAERVVEQARPDGEDGAS